MRPDHPVRDAGPGHACTAPGSRALLPPVSQPEKAMQAEIDDGRRQLDGGPGA